MVPICKKIRSKSISISRKIIIITYLVWEGHSILLWVVFFLNNGFIICFFKRIANGIIQYPISFTTVAIPINAIERNNPGTSAGWSAHYINTVSLTSCYVYNVDAQNYNNLIVVGF